MFHLSEQLGGTDTISLQNSSPRDACDAQDSSKLCFGVSSRPETFEDEVEDLGYKEEEVEINKWTYCELTLKS